MCDIIIIADAQNIETQINAWPAESVLVASQYIVAGRILPKSQAAQ